MIETTPLLKDSPSIIFDHRGVLTHCIFPCACPGVKVHDGNTEDRGNGHPYSASCGIALVDNRSLSVVDCHVLNMLEDLNLIRLADGRHFSS